MIRNGISQTAAAEDASSAGARGRSWTDMRQCTQYMQDMHRENPAASVMISMGIGFGVGLLLANVLEGPTRRLFHQEEQRNMAERLGARVMDSLNDLLPRSMVGK